MNRDVNIDTQYLTGEKVSRMEWEKPYLEALIDHLQPSGKVLEVGFAFGHSSTHIQSFHPLSHTIIESDPTISIQAKAWASGNPNICIIEGKWDNTLPRLGVFDTIFFNDFRPELLVAKNQAHKVGNLAIQKGKNLIANIKETVPHLMSVCYSSSDIDLLFKSTDQSQYSHLSKFLQELMQNGQISKNQYDKVTTKYELQRVETSVMHNLENHAIPCWIFSKFV